MGFSISYSFKAIDKFTSVAKKIKSSVDKVSRAFIKLGKVMRNAGNKIVSVGKELSLKATLPIIAAGAALLKVASDAEETESKFSVVFKSIGEKAEKNAKTLARSYGLTTVKAKELLGDTGDLLTGYGFSQKAAMGLSMDLNKLAVDLASFTNYEGGAEGASRALTKALLGEREQLKMLGVAMNDQDIKNKVRQLVAKGMVFTSERQAKAVATLKIAYEQSKNAVGDFARTQDQFANQTRIAKSALMDMATSIGKKLIPIATKLMGKIIKVTRRITDWIEKNPKMAETILIFAGIVAAIGPLLIGLGLVVKVAGLALIGFGGLLKVVSLVMGVFKVAAFVMGFFSLPVLLVIGAVSALAVGGYYLIKKWSAVSKFFKEKLGINLDWVGEKIDWLKNKWANFVDFLSNNPVSKFVSGSYEKASNMVGKGWKNVKELFSSGSNLVGGIKQDIMSNQSTSPLVKQKQIKNTFDGKLDINIADKNKNVKSATFSKIGNLNVGLSGVGQ